MLMLCCGATIVKHHIGNATWRCYGSCMRAHGLSPKSSPPDRDGGADVGPLGQTFAREVRRLRELRGLSQTDLAAQLRERHGLKFHQATIDRVEKGARPCRPVSYTHLTLPTSDLV